jgi:hypothetical protein
VVDVAVTITDTRTTINECDATTGWSNTVSGQGLYTSDPDPWEPGGCMGFQVSNESGYAYRTVSYNLTSTLIYAPIQANGTMNNFANTGVGIVLGDGTNTIAYSVGGSDVGGFLHSTGPVRWIAYLLDTASLPTTYVTIAGSEASLNLGSITLFGIYFYTLAKSLGGTENCFVDILRWGTGGIRITGGGTGTEGSFDDIATADRSTSTEDGAYSLCRELASTVYGLQGPITFGDSAGTSAIDFESTGETVVFEPPYNGVATSRFWLKCEGNSTGTSSIIFSGDTFICPTGIGGAFDATDADIDTFTLDGCVLKGFDQGVDFLSATTTNTHTVTDNIFDGCDQLTLGFLLQDGTFTGNTIQNTTASTTGALLLGSTGYTSGLDLTYTTFISGGTGHAIYITQAGTYDFQYLDFVGYAAQGGTETNRAVYNNSGGSVTINAQECTGLTYRNGASATTTINQSVTLTVTVVDQNGDGIVAAQTAVYKQSDDTQLMNEDTVSGGVATESYNYPGSDTPVYIRVRKSSTGSTRYKSAVASGTVTADGMNVTITMSEEPIS